MKIHGRRYVRSDETFVAGGKGERGKGRGWRNRMSRMNAKTLLAIIIYEYKYESEKDVRVRHGFGNLKIMRPDPRPVPFCRGSSTETTITYFALLRAPISYTR